MMLSKEKSRGEGKKKKVKMRMGMLRVHHVNKTNVQGGCGKKGRDYKKREVKRKDTTVANAFHDTQLPLHVCISQICLNLKFSIELVVFGIGFS